MHICVHIFAANELVRLRQQLEAVSRELQEKSNEHHLVFVKGNTLESAAEREHAVLNDKEQTLHRLQHQMEDGSRRAAEDLQQLRRGREQRVQEYNDVLQELAKRLQDLKMERIAAENEVQMIQVDGAGQLHDMKLSAQELAALVPGRLHENQMLREDISAREQEILIRRTHTSECEEERTQLLEAAALETEECQHICRNTETIDSEIIKSIQREHAMDCMLAGTRKEFEETDFELTQELLNVRNHLVQEHQHLLAEREEILNNQRGIQQLCELNENLASRAKEFESMRFRHLGRLHDNVVLHDDLTAGIAAVDTLSLIQEFQSSTHQSSIEIQHSIQALERHRIEYESRHNPTQTPFPIPDSPPQQPLSPLLPLFSPFKGTSHTEELIKRMPFNKREVMSPLQQPLSSELLRPMSPLENGSLFTPVFPSRQEEARRVVEEELEEARRKQDTGLDARRREEERKVLEEEQQYERAVDSEIREHVVSVL